MPPRRPTRSRPRRNPAKVRKAAPLKYEKAAKAIPAGVRLWAWDEDVPDVATFLARALFARHGERGQIGTRVDLGLTHPVYNGGGAVDDDTIGAVELHMQSSIPPAWADHRVWYVPIDSAASRGLWNRDDRYKSVVDAVAVSLRRNRGAAFYVGAFDANWRLGEAIAGGTVRLWGNPDYLAEDAIARWWMSAIEAIPVGPAWSWLGSDDPMDWHRAPRQRNPGRGRR